MGGLGGKRPMARSRDLNLKLGFMICMEVQKLQLFFRYACSCLSFQQTSRILDLRLDMWIFNLFLGIQPMQLLESFASAWEIRSSTFLDLQNKTGDQIQYLEPCMFGFDLQ